MSDSLLSDLIEKGERATPGPWRNDWRAARDGETGDVSYVTSCAEGLKPDGWAHIVVGEVWYDGYNTAIKENDAEYIAACSPSVLLPLLRELEERRKAIVEHVAASDAFTALLDSLPTDGGQALLEAYKATFARLRTLATQEDK